MAEPDPKPDPEQEGLLKRLRLPAAVMLAFLLMVGAYYTLHYRENYDYLASRNFRLLATMGSQVRDAVKTEGRVFSYLAGTSLDLKTLSPRISPCAAEKEAEGRLPDQITDEFKGKLKLKLKLWRELRSSDGAYQLSFSSEAQKNLEQPVPYCGEVELKDLLDPLFNSRQAFDAVLLANSEGKVVYLHGPKSLRVQQLDLLIRNRRDAKVVPEKDKDKGEDGGFDAFQGYSGSAKVELGGRLYTAFVQPFSLPLAFVETDPVAVGKPVEKSNPRPRDVWLLAGLVANDEIATKSLALSPSSVAFLLGILLLAALAWPLVKLRMLGERQRVKKTDVLLVGVCSLLGVSVATLFVLDLGAYSTLKSSSERQLKDFAEQMESNLLVEIRRAYDQLRDLERRQSAGPSLAASSPRQVFYPHFESFALIDDQGWQVFKATTGTITPLISVDERLYFQRIRQGMPLRVPEPEKKAACRDEPKAADEPFFLESVQSWTNGEWQAVLAKPAAAPTNPPAQVAALAVRMLSLIDPVVPQGFEFAVVGDDGTVLFHSDSARNLAENFYEETDQDRRFKSIVSSRHDEPLDIHYWGDSYRAFAIPVKGLPWTIVAMRKQQVLERVNLDWLVTTLILILLYTSAITLTLTAIALLRPGYRAGWVWPDPHRRHDYVQLVAIFGVFCLAFLIALFGLRGTGFLFLVAALLPGLSLVAAYLKLNQAGDRTAKKGAVVACGVVFLALLWLVLRFAPLEDGFGLWVPWTVRALVVCALLLAADGPRWWRKLAAGDSLPMSRSYPVLGLLLVLLAAVLPTVGFFKVAHRLQVNSFVRNGQLKMAKDLQERVALLNKKTHTGNASPTSSLTVTRSLMDKDPATRGLRSRPSLDFYGAAFFNTTLRSSVDCKAEKEESEPLAWLLPPYSDYTAENREMLHTRTSDDDWSWCEKSGKTLFAGENYLGVSLASEIEPAWRGNGPFLAMAGLLPPWRPTDLVERTYRQPVTPGPKEAESLSVGQVARVLLACGVLALSGILLYALVTFVARRIFLLDVQEPMWEAAEGTLAPIVGRNLFLVRKSLMSKAEAAAMSLEYLDLRQIDAGRESREWVWAKRCRELVDSGRNLVVAGFEHRISDPAFNARKLELLESLIEMRERSIIVLSQVSPARLFASEPAHLSAAASEPPATYERWRTVLSSFTVVEEDLRSRPAVNGGTGSLWGDLVKPFLRWRRLVAATAELFLIKSPVLRVEGGSDPFLLQIAHGVDSGGHEMGREQQLEEFGERAYGYYGALWASCSRDERVVLGHLAEEGLVNAKNRRIVRRLMARGLIQRAPNLCLMNETFRRFVASPVCREQVLTLEQAAGRSAWDRFHWPFSAALAACAAVILVTQQELLDSTLAAVTGVSAGLPALLKVLDLLGWKRGIKSA